MRFALMIEPQLGMSYDDQLAVARRAEAAGFEALLRSDHYGDTVADEAPPSTDAWTVLGGLARETTRIRLGVLVSPVTFRHPGVVAKCAATADEMSGGRVELGLGAGWNELEHRRHGIPFPPLAERATMLEESLAIVRGLWEEPDGWSFRGRHWSVEDARCRPRPRELPGRDGRSPSLIVGGKGTPRSIRIAARWADEFNVTSADPSGAAAVQRALDDALVALGRAPGSIVRSAMVGTLLGRDRTELRDRERTLAAALGAGPEIEAWFAARRHRWIHGTPSEARATVERYREAGIERLVLQDFLAGDLELVDLIAEALIG